MAVKYHVNPETGRANICRAEKQCPLKGTDGKPAEHFTDKAEAKAHGEKMLASIHGATTTLKKPAKAGSKPAKQAKKSSGLTVPKGMTPTEAKRIQEEKIKLTTQQGQRTLPAVKAEKPVEKQAGKSDEIASKFLDKNRSMADNKQMLVDFVSNKDNYEKIKQDFEDAGYDAETSAYVQNLRRGDAGANSVLRQAQKDAIAANKEGANVSVSDVLIYAEEASEEYYDSIGADRFSDSSSRFAGTEEVDLDSIEEAPEFLKDDPDFAIDEDEEEDAEDED